MFIPVFILRAVALLVFSLSSAMIFSASELGSQQEALHSTQVINASYKVKASFFALPINAKIRLEKFGENHFKATVNIKSPFFDLYQVETVSVSQCNVQLKQIDSQGNRIGSKDWDEKADIEWPSRRVTYYRDGSLFKNYLIGPEPSGFTSMFAHHFTSLMREEAHKVFYSVQSKHGVQGKYLNRGREENVSTKFYKNKIAADRLVIIRTSLDEKDMPSVWYQPEKLGAFPLKMTMKLGIFSIEAQLKKVDAQESDIIGFFDTWGC